MENNRYIRKEKKNYYLSHPRVKRKLSVSFDTIKNATIIPYLESEDDKLLFGLGGVIDSNGQYMNNSGVDGRYGGGYPYSEIEKKNEKVVYCGLLVNQWGHFLCESVSRLWYSLYNDDDIDKYVFICNDRDFILNGNFRLFFELLGIEKKIEILTTATKYREVVVPDCGYLRMNYYSEEYKNIFNRVIKRALERNIRIDYYEKVFLSRAHLEKAKITDIGMDMINNYFEVNNYKIVYPEEIPLDYFITILNKANIIATTSGSIAHNLLFTKDSTECIVIERQPSINEFQLDIDTMKRMKTEYIDAYWLIFPSVTGAGPFLFGNTRQLQQFSEDNNYINPSSYYLSERYRKKNLGKFIKTHHKWYVYDWGLEDWTIKFSRAIVEAHNDTTKEFATYLCQNKPFLFEHFISFNYIKTIIKKIIKK